MKKYKEYTQEEVHAMMYRFIRNYEGFIKDKTSNSKLKVVLSDCDIQFNKWFDSSNYTWIKNGHNVDEIKMNHIYMTKIRQSVMLSFLRHLRNALCHNGVTEENNMFQIKNRRSGIGCFEKDMLLQLIEPFCK